MTIGIKGKVRYEIHNVDDEGNIIDLVKASSWIDNLTPSTGLVYIVEVLAGETDRDLDWYTALGSNSAVSSSTMTQLGNELVRVAVGSKMSLSGGILSARSIVYPSAGSGTWYEVGLFVEGSTTINSGTLLSRIIDSAGIIKTARQILTVDHQLTFASTAITEV